MQVQGFYMYIQQTPAESSKAFSPRYKQGRKESHTHTNRWTSSRASNQYTENTGSESMYFIANLSLNLTGTGSQVSVSQRHLAKDNLSSRGVWFTIRAD